MSNDIKTIKNTGRNKNTALQLISYYGGDNMGEMLQITQGMSHIHITKSNAIELMKVLKDWASKEFYMTLGSGQPHYPGYFIAIADNENEARLLTSNALNGRWCGTYRSLEEVHPLDRIFRGTISAQGIELAIDTLKGEGEDNV